MKNKIVALLLALLFISGTTAYAVPEDLWHGDDRVVNLFTEVSAAKNFDVIQKLIDYIGVAEKDSISGENEVKSSVMLRALAKIAGISFEDDTDVNQITNDLKKAKLLRDSTKASYITMSDVLYAGARITGWAVADTDEISLYNNVRKSGLLRNIEYGHEKKLTCAEAAQFLYNILSVNTKSLMAAEYNGSYVSIDKNTEEPILHYKYGIIMKNGLVTSVFGESIYNYSTLNENEIELDGKLYKFNPNESQSNLVGRNAVAFVEEESDLVLFAEATVNNEIHVINFGEKPLFTSNLIEYYTNEGKQQKLNVSSDTKVIYNGMLVGGYSSEMIKNYFKEGTEITAVDNNGDRRYDYLMVRYWESIPVLLDASASGIVKFDHGRTYEGETYIDLTPEDDTIHVTVLKDGDLADYSVITTGSIVSISSNANQTGHKYILVETYTEQVAGELVSVSGNIYTVNGQEYPVAQTYLDAMNRVSGVTEPVVGQICTFYVDITGRIINATVMPEYSYGYIVDIAATDGLEPTCKVKMFTSEGLMEELNVSKKLVLHDDLNQLGRTVAPVAFAEYMAAKGRENENGDFRCLVQYKLDSNGEIVKIWFPIDNMGAEEFGQAGYQFTKDVVNTSYVTYSGGVVKDNYWGASTILFSIPTEIDAIDSRYTIKKPSYHGSRWTHASEFYCVDEFHNIPVAVMHMTDSSNIDNYSSLLVVDRVVTSVVGDNDEIGYKIYGTVNGEEASYSAIEDIASIPCNSGWLEGVKLTELQFGDIIQVYQAEGFVQLFRILYRINDDDDYVKNSDGGSKDSGQLAITTGNYVTHKGNSFKYSQTVSGVTNTYFKFFATNKTANIIDTKTKKVTRTTVLDLVPGDKIVIYSKRKTVQRVYVIR